MRHGAILRGRDSGATWLSVRVGEATRLVHYPVESLGAAFGDEPLEPIGEDLPSARVLALRLESAEAARPYAASIATTPVRSAMVLCAGRGIRFRPLTDRLPKPAIPFLGAPTIRYSFAALKRAGVRKVVINTHHLSELMEAVAAAEAASLGLDLVVLREPSIQGTGGALREARGHLGDETFFLMNGDAFASFDLRALLALHRERGAAATLALCPMPRGATYGAVEMQADGAIRRISGHGPGGPALSPWHFLGAHVIEPSVFDHLPDGLSDIAHDVYPAMVEAGLEILGAPVAVGAWADLGTPRRYLDACADVMTGLCDLSALGDHAPLDERESRLLRHEPTEARSLVDSTARLCVGARVVRSSVGADCVIGEGALVRDAAVLPGTRIAPRETLEGALAFQELRLEPSDTSRG